VTSRGQVAIVVGRPPFSVRASRSELDVALAAAALELNLELFFIGPAVWHLVEDKQPEAAGLSRGTRGWKLLPQLAPVNAWADSGWLERAGCRKLMLPVAGLDAAAMGRRIARCDTVLSL
jgi:sulfur relay (sulfurtransferase) DsrF/TusC family protein